MFAVASAIYAVFLPAPPVVGREKLVRERPAWEKPVPVVPNPVPNPVRVPPAPTWPPVRRPLNLLDVVNALPAPRPAVVQDLVMEPTQGTRASVDLTTKPRRRTPKG